MLHQVKPTPRKNRSIPGLRALTEWESLLTMFKKRSESALDAELAWRDFHKAVPQATMDRYVRVNPKTINPTPKMDDKSQVENLHDEIRSGLDAPAMRTKVAEIAQRLIASSFFFDKPSPSRHTDGRVTVQGQFSYTNASRVINLKQVPSNAGLRTTHTTCAAWAITLFGISDQNFNHISEYRRSIIATLLYSFSLHLMSYRTSPTGASSALSRSPYH